MALATSRRFERDLDDVSDEEDCCGERTFALKLFGGATPDAVRASDDFRTSAWLLQALTAANHHQRHE